jgi:hypothetical protein
MLTDDKFKYKQIGVGSCTEFSTSTMTHTQIKCLLLSFILKHYGYLN